MGCCYSYYAFLRLTGESGLRFQAWTRSRNRGIETLPASGCTAQIEPVFLTHTTRDLGPSPQRTHCPHWMRIWPVCMAVCVTLSHRFNVGRYFIAGFIGTNIGDGVSKSRSIFQTGSKSATSNRIKSELNCCSAWMDTQLLGESTVFPRLVRAAVERVQSLSELRRSKLATIPVFHDFRFQWGHLLRYRLPLRGPAGP